MRPDFYLLARYAADQDEGAFAELVQRHLDHVYSTALRLVGGDVHLAEDPRPCSQIWREKPERFVSTPP